MNAPIPLVATVTKYLVRMMTVIKSVDALVSVNVRQSEILANVEYDSLRNTRERGCYIVTRRVTVKYSEIIAARLVVAMLSATVIGLTAFILWSN